MNATRGLGLRTLSIAYPVAIIVFLGVIASALWLVLHSFNQVEQVLDRRKITLDLTAEFSGITEMSARLVRAFATTGDTRFLTYYYGLAEYRNGKNAPPADDLLSYWEEVIAGLRKYEPAAETAGKTFPQRMRDAGFPSEELAVLDEALAIGERLERIEQIAFAATQGLYDPAKAEFVSDGKPNTDFALKLVYGTEYEVLQAKLNLAVSRLARLADARTALAVRNATDRLLQAVLLAGAAISILLALALLASYFIDRFVLKPIQKFAAVAEPHWRGRIPDPSFAVEGGRGVERRRLGVQQYGGIDRGRHQAASGRASRAGGRPGGGGVGNPGEIDVPCQYEP